MLDSLDRPLGERMTAISRPMLGLPYAIDPLGEGAGHDPDPLGRYDAYDCLTFVEEVLALALSADPAHASELRSQIRYGEGPPSYARRRHFMELQWLPGNVADGILVDTTTSYGSTTHLEREITAASWKRWGKRSLFALTDAELPLGKMALDVLPLDTASEWVPRIPDGAIVLTVRADNGVSPLFTTHLGFVVRDGGAPPAMRNASRRSAMRVIDEDLAWYVEHMKTYTNWPVAGIAVFEPLEQAPRRAALP